MKKTTKGALAAGAAGALLLGGAGSLAYWSGTGTISGSSIRAGELTLNQVACGDWQLDSTGGTGGDLADRLLVPGDTITRVCTYTLHATGDHLEGTLDISQPTWTGDLAGKVTTSAAFDLDGQTIDPGTAFSFTDAGDKTLTATLSVAFPFGSGVDNTSQNLEATLDDITVTATQTDSHAS